MTESADRPIRTRTEILEKRHEVHSETVRMEIKLKRWKVLFVMPLNIIIVSVFLLTFSLMFLQLPVPYLFASGIALFFITLLIHAITSTRLGKLKRTIKGRKVLTETFDEILEILGKPNGEKVLYHRLDEMIASGKGKAGKWDKINRWSGDYEYINPENYKLQAYTWVASPGGVPEPEKS